MNTIPVIFTPRQRDRTLEFLRRVTLTGKEVPAYAEIFNLISGAKAEAAQAPASDIHNS